MPQNTVENGYNSLLPFEKIEANKMRFAEASGLKKEPTCYSMNPVMINSGKRDYLQNLQLHILACR